MASLNDVINDPLQPATLAPGERLYVSPNQAPQTSDPENTQVPDMMPSSGNALTKALTPQPTLSDMIARVRDYMLNGGIGMAGVEDRSGQSEHPALKKLFGLGGTERYQLWPERVVRSGFTAPHDAMTGELPMRVWDNDSGEFVINPEVIRRAQDTAGLMSGGALIERPGAATLGSGPVRRAATVKPTEPAPVFYSALEHAATNAAQDTMSPQQWLGYLKNRPGVKQEELDWSGLEGWLGTQKGKVRKEDMQSYLDAHKTEIRDVTKSGRQATDEVSDDLHDNAVQAVLDEFLTRNPRWEGRTHTPAFERAHENFANGPEGEAIWNRVMQEGKEPEGSVKYSSYQLPGGENYREHLLTLPPKTKNFPTLEEYVKKTYTHEYKDYPPDVQASLREAYQKGRDESLLPDSANYRSSHWDEPNVLAHVRTNDRNIGGQKSLHIEEIQSDWHQQGRKQGYNDRAKVKEFEDGKVGIDTGDGKPYNGWLWPKEDMAEAHGALSDLREGGDVKGVPDAPFKSSWPELALKRMIRHAAENGYDRISWTPGEAQAARYDLSKHFDQVDYNPTSGDFQAYKDGRNVYNQMNVKPEDLTNIVGKDVAEKLMAQGKDTPKSVHSLKELDLKVGGEGMREFYDRMLPKMAERIGKAHGVKVKQTPVAGHTIEIRHGNDWLPTDFVNQDQAVMAGNKPADIRVVGDQPVHYFDLPQSLKDVALHRGFPLYMTGVPFPLVPVDGDPFKKDK